MTHPMLTKKRKRSAWLVKHVSSVVPMLAIQMRWGDGGVDAQQRRVLVWRGRLLWANDWVFLPRDLPPVDASVFDLPQWRGK